MGGDPQWFEKLQRIVHLADALLPLFKDAFQSRQRMIELIDGLDQKIRSFPLCWRLSMACHVLGAIL